MSADFSSRSKINSQEPENQTANLSTRPPKLESTPNSNHDD